MRTFISTLALLFMVAQTPALEMAVGAKGGIGLSMWYGADQDDIYDDQVMKLGFAGGALFRVQFMDYFAVQPEVLFTMKGQKIDLEEDAPEQTSTAEITRSINYLEVPILFVGRFPLEVISPQAYIGPAFAFRMGTGADVEFDEDQAGTDFPGEEEENTEMEDWTNSFDFGIAFGIGIWIDAGPGNFLVDIRYTLGLIDVYNEDEVPEGEDFQQHKNAVTNFMAGYAVDF